MNAAIDMVKPETILCNLKRYLNYNRRPCKIRTSDGDPKNYIKVEHIRNSMHKIGHWLGWVMLEIMSKENI